MNASYKIVLLAAFVLFAAVVGYYIFSGDGESADELALNDAYPEQEDPTDDTGPEPVDEVIEPEPVVEPEPTRPSRPSRPTLEPGVESPDVATIGETTDDLPQAPVIGTPLGEGPLASADPSDDLARPAPATTSEESPAEEPSTSTQDTAEPGADERPAPEPETTDPTEATADPVDEPEAEPEAEPETEPTRPVPPAPGSIPRTYTVQAGDTFASIAARFYGEERAWFDIAQANPSVDPKRLQVDQVIVLPNRETTVREREEVQPPAPGNDQNYTVRPGDNLSKIAKKFYGDSEKWDLIYARNRKLIGPRPDALKVGMDLVIPQAYDGAE